MKFNIQALMRALTFFLVPTFLVAAFLLLATFDFGYVKELFTGKGENSVWLRAMLLIVECVLVVYMYIQYQRKFTFERDHHVKVIVNGIEVETNTRENYPTVSKREGSNEPRLCNMFDCKGSDVVWTYKVRDGLFLTKIVKND